MNKVGLLILLFVLILSVRIIAKTSVRNECNRCDMEILKQTEENLSHLSNEQVIDFLCTFSPSCGNNVEYSEFSNELLFKVLDRYTVAFLRGLKDKQIFKEYIYDRLSNPLLDVDVNGLRSKVLSAKNVNKSIRDRILNSLDHIGR